ncbi:hypothetical protein [Micromonospora echinofusca]|uniref:hypothetical protein n=1 Tax=Micromonospora echinofusca TaxID=47858 RepID=UPI0033EA3A9E
MLPAVDLHVHPPPPEPDVEIAATPVGVASNGLPGRLRQPPLSHQVEEIQLGQGMRASGGVLGGPADQAPAPDPEHAVQHHVQVVAADEALLEARGDDRPGLLVSHHPLRRVDQ